jgi:branched-chain amino acid transport system ATP-binding protein
MMTLEVRGINVFYGKSHVLSDIELAVPRGEIVAVVGRNGMGKTTLMKSLMGLLSWRSGEAFFHGTNLTRLPAHRRARLGIGYVPQGREIFGKLTVDENLRVGMERRTGRVKPNGLEKVHGLFPLLKERRKQLAGTLSGGEQQMLAIARALIGEPDLLLLDEPTEGLQPSIVQLIEELLRNVNQQDGTTILLTEQNLDIVFKLTSKCYILEKGRIVKAVLPAQLKDEELIKAYLVV